MQTFFTNFLREFQQARTTLLHRIMLLTGTGEIGALGIFILISIELLVFLLFIPLHRKLLKRLQLTKQTLVQTVDEVIYLLAKAQYESKISKKDLGGDPHMAMMKEMFKSGHFEYLNNIALIQENVKKVELLLQKQVVSPELRSHIVLLQKKMKRLLFWDKGLGIFCSIFTVGIYKLFR